MRNGNFVYDSAADFDREPWQIIFISELIAVLGTLSLHRNAECGIAK